MMWKSQAVRRSAGVLAVAALTLVGGGDASAQGTPDCAAMARFAIPGGRVTAATLVPAGGFIPPGGTTNGGGPAPQYKTLPAFCRVAIALTPTTDSDIRSEVWLPADGWNGKLQMIGNGGWSGAIGYAGMARALATGYAATSTDTGHSGGSAEFAIGHPEKLRDFSYRGVHLTTVAAKAIVGSHYARAATHSYWNGCSSGGRQGLTEAQRFPDDFDGIVAGAPANNWVNQKVAHIMLQQIVNRDADSNVPASKYPMVHEAMLNACDALDGVKDGVLSDPRACTFDPKVLACKGADGPNCLTSKQVASAQAIYSPMKHPKTGALIFPGLPRGTELSWATPAGPNPRDTQEDLLKFVVFEDPKWDYKTFDFERHYPLALKNDAEIAKTASVDPNLKPFFGGGGKLLLYHGWADPNIVSINTVNYVNEVTKSVGAAAVADSMRLFMIPGMGHCGGGKGTDTFDMVEALDRWVTRGEAPTRIEAARVRNGVTDRTRPLCPYPQAATYKGSGSIDDSANFECRVPAQTR